MYSSIVINAASTYRLLFSHTRPGACKVTLVSRLASRGLLQYVKCSIKVGLQKSRLTSGSAQAQQIRLLMRLNSQLNLQLGTLNLQTFPSGKRLPCCTLKQHLRLTGLVCSTFFMPKRWGRTWPKGCCRRSVFKVNDREGQIELEGLIHPLTYRHRGYFNLKNKPRSAIIKLHIDLICVA